MIRSQITRLPTIERKSSARTINQMIKSIKDYSLEKRRLLNFSSDSRASRPVSSSKNTISKINLELPEKLPISKKLTLTTNNSLASDNSGAEIQRYQVALSNRVIEIRGLISQIIEKSPLEDSRNRRQMSCREPRSARYAKIQCPLGNETNNLDAKPKDKKESCSGSPTKDTLTRPRNLTKPALKIVFGASKASKPLFNSSPENQLKPFAFQEDLRPWSKGSDSEF